MMPRALFLILAGLVSLTACSSVPEPMPRASAVAETVRVEMPVDPRDSGLTWAQQELIEALAGEYKARGHGPFVISYPQNAGNADAALGAIADVRNALYAHGLDWQQIGGGAYEARGAVEAPVIFSFTRYRAVAPVCENRWSNVRNAGPGSRWGGFGCATEHNLAAMIADPRDLGRASAFDDPDAARRQTVLDSWRQGQSTTSERSADESGAVSRVVD